MLDASTPELGAEGTTAILLPAGVHGEPARKVFERSNVSRHQRESLNDLRENPTSPLRPSSPPCLCPPERERERELLFKRAHFHCTFTSQ